MNRRSQVSKQPFFSLNPILGSDLSGGHSAQPGIFIHPNFRDIANIAELPAPATNMETSSDHGTLRVLCVSPLRLCG